MGNAIFKGVKSVTEGWNRGWGDGIFGRDEMLPAVRLAALSGWASYHWVAALLGHPSTKAGIDV